MTLKKRIKYFYERFIITIFLIIYEKVKLKDKVQNKIIIKNIIDYEV
mgnify:FL=1|tara:strand:- start:1298 stop:1438 length:141 start_codon:yes stop_codon:yes gene_type:complete